MTKNIFLTLFFASLTFAIISDIGQPQHTYRVPHVATLAD